VEKCLLEIVQYSGMNLSVSRELLWLRNGASKEDVLSGKVSLED
jgi:hypothetical protein